jgi:ABC-2 type transport system ATP-binding protein
VVAVALLGYSEDMSEAAIITHELHKRYPHTAQAALEGLSIEIHRGEIYGFLGANGAGKTTTIRLLLNFLQPTGGGAKILGLDVVRQSVDVKKHVGYLAGDVALYPKVTGRELLDYLGVLHGIKDTAYRKTLEKRFEAETDKPIGTLSKGNRQKIGILQAFMHQPDVLILDEPTSGLDPLMQEQFYKTLEECKSRGAAILMSSHNLVEAQRICDRVGIIKHGKLIREQAVHGDVSFGKPLLHVLFAAPADVTAIKKSPAVQVVSQFDENGLILQPTGSIAGALKALSNRDIKDLQTSQADLEDEFLEFYGGQQ